MCLTSEWCDSRSSRPRPTRLARGRRKAGTRRITLGGAPRILLLFARDNFDFGVVTVHLRWGSGTPGTADGTANWARKRSRDERGFDRDLLVVGDMNIPSRESEPLRAVSRHGLRLAWRVPRSYPASPIRLPVRRPARASGAVDSPVSSRWPDSPSGPRRCCESSTRRECPGSAGPRTARNVARCRPRQTVRNGHESYGWCCWPAWWAGGLASGSPIQATSCSGGHTCVCKRWCSGCEHWVALDRLCPGVHLEFTDQLSNEIGPPHPGPKRLGADENEASTLRNTFSWGHRCHGDKRAGWTATRPNLSLGCVR